MKRVERRKFLALSLVAVAPMVCFSQSHNDKWRAAKQASLEQLIKIRAQDVKYNRSTAEVDAKIAQVKNELKALPSGEDTKTSAKQRQLMNYQRIRKTYQKSGRSTAHIDKQIEKLQRELSGQAPIKNPPSKLPKKAGGKLDVTQNHLDNHRRTLATLNKTADRYRAKGKPVPSGLVSKIKLMEGKIRDLEAGQ